MTDLTLHDGKEIAFDMNAFRLDEYLAMFEDDKDNKSEDKQNVVVGKATGMKPEDIKSLGFEDNRKLFAAFFSKAREVTKDPNSESAST